MRLDKFLAEVGLGSRKEVKQLIKKGQISVNQKIEKSDKKQIDPEKDQVDYQGEILHYQEFYYYLLHKPAGVVSATEDKQSPIQIIDRSHHFLNRGLLVEFFHPANPTI